MNTQIRYPLALCMILCVTAVSRAEVRIEQIPGQAELGTVEIHGVSAGPFDAKIWQNGRLHILPDVRSPLISPRISGVFRNIYAPSAVELPEGWRLFYGAWDGVNTTNDRIYSVMTKDFLDFEERKTVIDHGVFVHVCNVNAIRQRDGSFHMVCTVYPDDNGRNKIAAFSSPDGHTWNGSPTPYPASKDDIIEIEGYPGFSDADMNGMNVVLREGNEWRLYFGDFRQRTHVRRASSRDGRHFTFEGPCLEI